MNRFDLLTALKEAEDNSNRHFIEVVERERAAGNPVDHLYDPRNDAPVEQQPPLRRKRPGAIRDGKHRNKHNRI